jgi:hypothetical protein
MSGGRRSAVKPQRLPAIRSRQRAAVPDQEAKTGLLAQSPAYRSYATFDAWLELGGRLAGYYRELVDVIEGLEAEDASAPASDAKSWSWSEGPAARLKRRTALVRATQMLLVRFPADEIENAVAAFAEGHSHYERDALYEAPDRRILSSKFVASRIALLLGAYPAGTPSDPDVYTRRLVEEVIAVEPTATQVEAATRVWIRTSKFLPAPSELLGAVRAARTPEYDDAFALDEAGVPLICWARDALAKRIVGARPPANVLPPREARHE